MQIWVDADACPNVIKEILFRAADRTQVRLTLVANRALRTSMSPYIRSIRVAAGFDVVDHRIVQLVQPGDLVVTEDIPLAAEVIGKAGLALSPRGVLFSEENIQERLAVRNLMDDLRSTGVEIGGPASLSKSDRQAFANHLDRLLSSCRTEP